MSSESTALPSAAPDRLFARATAIFLCVGLAMVLAGHLVLDQSMRRQAAVAEIALVSADEAAAARAVAATLDRLAMLPDAPARDTERTRLAWDIDALIGLERARLAAVSALTGAPAGPSAILTAAEDVAGRARQSTGLDGFAAGRLRATVEAQLQPQLDSLAMRTRRDTDRAGQLARWAIAGSLVLHLIGAAALVLAVLRPTRRRIGAWVAESNELDRENRFRLLHDPVTRMPNAAYLHAYLTRLIAGADRKESQTALLRIDLDRFRVLRETLGQRAADEIIRITARRIQHALRTGDFAAYLGQESFVVVTGDLEDANAAAAIAGRVQAALIPPYSIRGGARRISCSIGVALLSDDRADPDLLLGNAGIALSEAQGAGTGAIRYFREGLRVEVERREILFNELLHGLDSGEVVAFFQPQIDLRTGAFAGFEALVRWLHPRHGLLSPAAFLDFAEETDLTDHIGEVVLTRSLEALQAWDRAGLAVPKVGVNFALAQLSDARLIEKIKWEVERFDLDPSRLSIEVLETVLIKTDTDVTVRNLRGLASGGFRIELDDFGTGHASIQNLRRFMVNRIKIDRSFVFGIESSEELQQLTASMIAMAHALGIDTLAEGVETEAAETVLRDLGCTFAQGFLIARPMSLADTMRWLRGYQPGAHAPAALPSPGRADPNTP